jgi:hypothetical protein
MLSPFSTSAVGIVDEAIEDGVGQRRIADGVVPMLDRHLAGNDGGRAAVAIGMSVPEECSRSFA